MQLCNRLMVKSAFLSMPVTTTRVGGEEEWLCGVDDGFEAMLAEWNFRVKA